ncbi:MAG TPA: DUF2255 family protein [Thermomicrobiales bacterium]|nr:DUF2255 family protein [Thermomicrobiales bacterium]
MTTWTQTELDSIGEAEELRIRSRRTDGTLRKPVIIWVVRLDDNLYVRAVGGPDSPWFRGTQTRHEGHISAGGIERDVTFAPVDPALHAAIDRAYRAKYAHQPVQYVDPCVTPQAHAATLELIPT